LGANVIFMLKLKDIQIFIFTAILLTSFLHASVPKKYDWFLDAQKQTTQKSFYGAYIKFIKNKLLSANFPHKLLINTDPTKINFKEEGVKTLELLELLEKNLTPESAVVLEKLNKLYLLEFTRFINQLKCPDEEKITAIASLNNLYYPLQKKITINVIHIRTLLTKMFIQMTIVNKTFTFHQKRKEAICLMLESIKRDLLDLQADETLNLQTKDIKKFMKILQLHAAKPLINQATKRFLIISAVTVVVIVGAILAWKYAIKPALRQVNPALRVAAHDIAAGAVDGANLPQQLDRLEVNRRLQEAVDRLNLPGRVDGLEINRRLQEAVDGLNLPARVDLLEINRRLQEAVEN